MEELLKQAKVSQQRPPAGLGGYQQVSCPCCRGYALESSWCDHCNRTGVIAVFRAPAAR